VPGTVVAPGASDEGRFPVRPAGGAGADGERGGVAGNQRVSGIVTPEAVVLHFETAGVASRALARLIDLTVQLMLLLLVIGAAGAVAGAVAGVLPVGGQEVIVVVVLFATTSVLVGYPIVAEALWDGRTVGKVLFGLRVITREGAPVRARHTSVRGIIGLVEVLLLPFVAVLSCALSATNQRVGDFAAGTMVVRHRSGRRGGVALMFPPPIGLEHYAAGLDVSRVTPTQYRILRSFLTRVGDLRPEARVALGARLVTGMADLVGPPPPQLDGELYLVCAAAAYQRRHGTVTPTGGRAPAPAWGPPAWSPPPPPGWSSPAGWATSPYPGPPPYPVPPAYPAGRR
jgi:uncharacterized RDD family membrane protein YckC